MTKTLEQDRSILIEKSKLSYARDIQRYLWAKRRPITSDKVISSSSEVQQYIRMMYTYCSLWYGYISFHTCPNNWFISPPPLFPSLFIKKQSVLNIRQNLIHNFQNCLHPSASSKFSLLYCLWHGGGALTPLTKIGWKDIDILGWESFEQSLSAGAQRVHIYHRQGEMQSFRID